MESTDIYHPVSITDSTRTPELIINNRDAMLPSNRPWNFIAPLPGEIRFGPNTYIKLTEMTNNMPYRPYEQKYLKEGNFDDVIGSFNVVHLQTDETSGATNILEHLEIKKIRVYSATCTPGAAHDYFMSQYRDALFNFGFYTADATVGDQAYMATYVDSEGDNLKINQALYDMDSNTTTPIKNSRFLFNPITLSKVGQPQESLFIIPMDKELYDQLPGEHLYQPHLCTSLPLPCIIEKTATGINVMCLIYVTNHPGQNGEHVSDPNFHGIVGVAPGVYIPQIDINSYEKLRIADITPWEPLKWWFEEKKLYTDLVDMLKPLEMKRAKAEIVYNTQIGFTHITRASEDTKPQPRISYVTHMLKNTVDYFHDERELNIYSDIVEEYRVGNQHVQLLAQYNLNLAPTKSDPLPSTIQPGQQQSNSKIYEVTPTGVDVDLIKYTADSSRDSNMVKVKGNTNTDQIRIWIADAQGLPAKFQKGSVTTVRCQFYLKTAKTVYMTS